MFEQLPLDPSLGNAAREAREAREAAAVPAGGVSASEDPAEEERVMREVLEVSEGLDFNIAEGGEEEVKETDEAVDVE